VRRRNLPHAADRVRCTFPVGADGRFWISANSVGFREDERAYQPFLCVRRCGLHVDLATLGKRWRDFDVHVILDND
jgi:hypothetical protein